ncbi:SpoIIE family protein phosphatase [uncultured Microscilla sp.]|uniref:SpoIIE family protein phosphatase n=1 Tax=uncultured Microscilla sp. TaxID=432653 RepID=UPI002632865A|nr:SpoIIE family protein phosphatase [uncultured Microscilla sp.]
MRKALIYIWWLLLITGFAQGQIIPQKQGKVLLENYTPKMYKGDRQVWAVTQDQQGIMYFGHDKGLVQYDGVTWRHELMPKNTRVRSMGLAKDGTLYIGSSGNFGYLDPNPQGFMKFVSLLPTVPKKQRNFSDVWKTIIAGDKVYFVTLTQIFCYQNKKLYKIYQTTQKHFFHLSFGVYDQLWQPLNNQGIAQLKADSLHTIKGTYKAERGRIYAMIPYPGNKILIIDALSEFWLYDLHSRQLVPFAPHLSKVLGRDEVYSGTALPNGQFALGTRTKGIVIIDLQGQIINAIDKSQGLVDNTVWDVYYQPGTQNLWVGTDKGITRITIGLPWELYDTNHGLEGSVEDVHNFKGKTYVTTSVGAFLFNKGKFKRLKGLSSQTWSFRSYNIPNSTEQRLLVANNRGVYALQDSVFKQAIPEQSSYSFCVDKNNPKRLYVGFLNGLGTWLYQNGRWETEKRRFEGIVDPPWQIIQNAQGKTWLATRYKGVGLLENNRVTLFDSLAGLPPKRVSMLMYQNKLYYCAQDGIYIFDEASRRFKPDLTFDKLLKTPHITFVAHDTTQTYWLTKNARTKRWIPYYKTAKGYSPDSLILKPIYSKKINTIDIDPNGVYWISTNEGLVKYNARETLHIQQQFKVLLRKVQIGQDSVLFAGNKLTKPPILPHTNNSLTFDYAALYFNSADKNEYSYQLVGYDKHWAKWTNKTQKEYTNLNEGTYTFKVKARNLYGITSNIATYEFTILPPWHRTWWAYTLFAVLFALSLFGGVKLYTNRLRKQKVILEHKVTVRTQEVVKQKEEIYEQNKELLQQSEELQQQSEEIMAQRDAIEESHKMLNERNYQITQSIKSAETIQAAILPFADRLQALIGEHFVIFRPRDVVSGDFYYIEQVGNITIAAAIDCTGHGVPGAFMSLIGYALLNDIIYAQQKTNPAQILETLRQELRNALKQEQTGKQHGMDVAMVTIEPQNNTSIQVHFAGAKRPLWYTTPEDDKIQVIKGSNVSIGIDYVEGRVITSQQLLLEKGSVLYLSSDGFADQNNQNRKKFGTRSLKTLLAQNKSLALPQQQSLLEQALDEFMQGTEQRDDILLIGIKL